MSSEVDQRIVEMRFDNRQFEKNAKTSINTINELDRKLRMSESTKGLDSVRNAIGRITFGGMEKGIDTVKMKFSALQIAGTTALMNITNSVVNAGKQMINGLTLDPIKQGFNEYELKMGSIQTIMASTGEPLKKVNKYLQELNTYSDKTIYSFSDMTQNIGKFTNAGVKLKDAVAAIQGVSNVAAVSGANANEASHAMYNFAQALSSGAVKLIDWKSIENANMATVEFKNELIKTAVECGTLKKSAKGMYTSLTTDAKGKTSEAFNSTKKFNESLSAQWMTTEVLTKTLKKYSDESTKLGKKAFAAAQDIKTFSQLMDTLKESVGSGWAETWEILFGNFDEAKKLWTNLNNVIEPILSKQSESRNKMLAEWKKLGGRKDLIDIFNNMFNGLVSVIKPVQEAFRDIFPPTTGKKLAEITANIKEFTAKLTLNKERSEKLKSTFKGLFSVIDLGGQAFSFLFKKIQPVFKHFGSFADKVLDMTAYWGDWLTELNKTVRETDAFNAAYEGIKTLLNDLGEKFKEAGEKVKTFFAPAIAVVEGVLGRADKRMDNTKKSVKDLKEEFKMGFDSIAKTVKESKAVKFLQKTWEVIKMIAGKVKDAFTSLGNHLATKAKDMSFNDILDAINALLTGGIAVAIAKFIKTVTKPFDKASGFIDKLKSILDSVRESFETWQMKLKADILMKIAGAIAILTVSLIALSLINSDKLTIALGAITGLFIELMGALKAFSAINDKMDGTKEACKAMISISFAVLILSKAMTSMAKLDWGQMARGLISTVVLIGSLTASLFAMSKMEGEIQKSATTLLAFAVSIRILASSVKAMSTLNLEQLAKGLGGVIVLLTSLSIFLNKTDLSADSIKVGTVIVLLATGIKMMTKACKAFAGMKWQDVATGLISIGILLKEISMLSKSIDDGEKMKKVAVSMIAISVAMNLFALAIRQFGSMDLPTLAKGMITFAITLESVTTAMNSLPKNMSGTGAQILLVAVAMNALGLALKIFASMNMAEIGKGLLTLVGSLAAMAVTLALINGVGMSGAKSLLLLAAALAVLAPPLMILSTLSIPGLVISLVTLAGAFAILGAAAFILQPVAPMLLTLAGSMALIGVSVAGIGAGLLLAGMGLTSLAGALAALAGTGLATVTAAMGAITVVVMGIGALIPFIIVQIGKGIVETIKLIGNSASAIAKAVGQVALAIIATIVKVTPKLIEGAVKILVKLLETILKYTPKIVSTSINILIAIIEGIAKKIPRIIKAGVDVILAFLKGISQNLGRVIQGGFDLIISFIEGITNAINKNTPRLVEAMKQLILAMLNAAVTAAIGLLSLFVDAGKLLLGGLLKGLKMLFGPVIDAIGKLVKKVKKAITDKVKDFVKIGSNIINGIKKGITNGIAKVKDAAKNVAKGALNAAKDALGIHSPSKEFMKLGQYVIDGFNKGISVKKLSTYKEIRDVLNKAIEYAAGAIEQTKIVFNLSTKKARDEVKKMADALYKETDAYKKSKLNLEDYKKNVKDLKTERIKLNKELTKETKNTIKLESQVNALEKKIKDFQYATNKKNNTTARKKELDALKEKKKLLEDELKQSKKNKESIQKDLEDVTQSIKDNNTAIKQENEQMVKDATDTFNSFVDNLKSSVTSASNILNASLDSQIDLFKEFSTESDVTKESILKNMQSQIDGITNWKKTLDELSNKGIASGLLEELKNMGPSGAAYIQQFAQMTTEEIEKANALFNSKSSISAETFIQNMREKVDSVKNWAANISALAGKGIEQGLLQKLQEMGPDSAEQVQAMMDMTVEQLGEVNKIYLESAKLPDTVTAQLVASYTYAGTDMAKGFSKGIANGASSAIAAATNMAVSALKAAKEALGIHSPSREFIKVGKNVDEGFIIGVKQYSGDVIDATQDMGNGAVKSMAKAISKISDIVNGEIDTTPTIRPVMDLSNIQNGMNRMNTMFSRAKALDINTQMNDKYKLMYSTGDNKEPSSNVMNMNLVQNNYSPKALSRAEIYRQTRNQFSAMKGLVNNGKLNYSY